jgi:biotin-[acetyl-CoA-carboxylase] ligase BirA-like protein
VSNWLSEGIVGRDWFGLDQFRPGPRFLRDGGCLYLLDEVGSTNEFLRGRGGEALGRRCLWDGWGWKGLERQRLTPPPDVTPGSVAVARRQTAGRGRQGRRWVDCGGLHMSVAVPPHRATLDQGFSVWLGLMSTMVLREDLRLDARLKWPNDILVGKRKLGGILLDTTGTGADRRVVAGLGLNLTTRRSEFPDALQGEATSVRIEIGHDINPGGLAGRIVSRVESELDRFQTDGWPPYREALSLLDALLGQEVVVRVGPSDIAGRVEGINERGELVVREADGDTRTFPAGDVHLQTGPVTARDSKEVRRASADH